MTANSELIEQAVEAARVARSTEDYDEVWVRLVAIADAGPDATAAVQLLASGEPARRATGCDLLGLISERFEEPRAVAAAALLDLLEHETDTGVLWSAVKALGSTGQPDALPALLPLAGHRDPGIRLQVATSLPSLMSETVDPRGVQALIELTRDQDSDVRNWATFGLGRQLEFDSSEVREVLWDRVGDVCADVREEAAASLARRRDRRALPLVADLLAGGEVPNWLFDAAASLADASLVHDLLDYGIEDPQVDRALSWCDPERRATRDAAIAALVERAQALLDERVPGTVVTTWCDVLDVGVMLSTRSGEEELVGWPEAILAAGAGDPAAAAALWVDRNYPPNPPQRDR